MENYRTFLTKYGIFKNGGKIIELFWQNMEILGQSKNYNIKFQIIVSLK